MEVTYHVEGLDDLEAQLLKIERGTGQEFLLDSLKVATNPVLKDMKGRIDRQFDQHTGQLIRIRRNARKFRGNRKAVHSAQVEIGPTRKASYALHLEYGTSHIKANPFMRPALDENVGTVISLFKKRLRQRLEAYTRNE